MWVYWMYGHQVIYLFWLIFRFFRPKSVKITRSHFKKLASRSREVDICSVVVKVRSRFEKIFTLPLVMLLLKYIITNMWSDDNKSNWPSYLCSKPKNKAPRSIWYIISSAHWFIPSRMLNYKITIFFAKNH